MKFPSLHGETLPDVVRWARQMLVELEKPPMVSEQLPVLSVVSNTQVKISYRGTDNVMRSVTLTLS